MDNEPSVFLRWFSNAVDTVRFLPSARNVNAVRISNKCGQTTGVTMTIFKGSQMMSPRLLWVSKWLKLKQALVGRLLAQGASALKFQSDGEFTQAAARSLVF